MKKLVYYQKALVKIIIIIFVAAIFWANQNMPVLALSTDQVNVLSSGILYFNTDECGDSSNTSPGQGMPAGSSVYILGDSITDRAQSAYTTAFQQQGITANIDASDGRSLSSPGTNGNKLSGMQAIQTDTAQIQKASAIIIALGTNGGDTPQSVDQAIAAIKSINSSAPIYWIDTMVVSRPSYDSVIAQANQAIYGEASGQGYTVIPWSTTVDPNANPEDISGNMADPNGYIDNSDGLGVHPTINKGVPALVNLVTNKVTGIISNPSGASESCCATASSASGGPSTAGSTAAVSAEQKQNAETILGIAKTDNLPESAGLIGLMVGLDESGLLNLANENVPLSEQNSSKQGDGSNGTSLGVFQQQIVYDWSTISSNVNDTAAIAQLMTPAYAAEAFYGSPSGSKAPAALSKGLQDVANWQTMQPWVAAQKVQASGTSDGSNYEKEVGNAQALLDQLWNSSPPVPLPVPITGGSGATTTSSGGNCSSSTTTSGSCNVTAPLYTKVLSVSELTAIYGDPGTANSHPQMDANLVTVPFDVGGNSKVFNVQVNKLVAPCLLAVAAQIKSENVNYTITSMGCYRFDSNNGTSNIGLMSYHTYGAACDINPNTNPFVESGANVPHDMPQQYIQAFEDHGFYWGGSWTQPKDFMHFEFHGIMPSS